MLVKNNCFPCQFFFKLPFVVAREGGGYFVGSALLLFDENVHLFVVIVTALLSGAGRSLDFS